MDPTKITEQATYEVIRNQIKSLTNATLEKLSYAIEFELWDRANLEDYERFYGTDYEEDGTDSKL